MINLAELTSHLQTVDVPADAYSIGRDRDEAYCLVREVGRWSVFYSERGRRTGEVRHTNEADACADLLGRLVRDHVVQSQLLKGHFW
ncbi:hypothetical protein ACN27F_23460 [Solwaraspora sp. WMMB335]|uniref:hypothetical protein n=1 Tax=Solwaraspora sp. WMMB335 TaxID=3404118 RepID=UPI003B95E319